MVLITIDHLSESPFFEATFAVATDLALRVWHPGFFSKRFPRRHWLARKKMAGMMMGSCGFNDGFVWFIYIYIWGE